MARAWWSVLVFVAGCSGGARSSDEPRASTPKPQAAAAAHGGGGLVWDASAPLVRHVPSSPVRAAEYGVEGDPGADFVVFYYGADQTGSVDANVARWLMQIEQPDGSETARKAKRAEFKVGGLSVDTVEATGVYTGPMATQPSAAPDYESTLLAAIVHGPKGPVMFKLTGRRDTIERARDAFDRLLRSVRPE